MIVPPFNNCDDEGYLFFYSFNDEYCVKAGRTVYYIEGGVSPYEWFFSKNIITFNGTDGDAPSSYWTEYDPNNNLAILDNHLDFSVSVLAGNSLAYVESIDLSVIEGDCDIEVDFEALKYYVPSNDSTWHYMGIELDDGTNRWAVMWAYYRSPKACFIGWYNRGLAGETKYNANNIGIFSGKLRIQRLSGVFKAYYKGSGEVDFHWLGYPYYTFPEESNNDLRLRLVFYKTAITLQEIQFQLWNIKNNTTNFSVPVVDYFSFASGITAEQFNFLTCAADTSLGEEDTIYISDACGTEVSHKVVCCDPIPCCTKADYAFTYTGEDPISIDINYEKVELNGGCPPYHWEITGITYSLSREWTNAPNNVLHREVSQGSGTSEVLTVTDECGTVINIDVLGCCDDPTYSFGFDPTMSWASSGGTISVAVVGGCSPFIWSVQPPNYMDSVLTYVRTNTINIVSSSYLIGRLEVQDSCGLLGMGSGSSIFRVLYNCDYGSDPFLWDSANSEEEVPRGGEVFVYILGGVPPFSWILTGTDFGILKSSTYGRTNKVAAGATACGSAVISVTDACGQVVSGSVRCTEGYWSDPTEIIYSFGRRGWDTCINGATAHCWWALPVEITLGKDYWYVWVGSCFYDGGSCPPYSTPGWEWNGGVNHPMDMQPYEFVPEYWDELNMDSAFSTISSLRYHHKEWLC